MKHVYIFPGQGSQFVGMGKALFDSNSQSRQIFEEANSILGFNISEIMFSGSEDELKQTRVTQPAIFLHSIAAYKNLSNPAPDMVAGHSLGEFSALVANGVLRFDDALRLVAIRAQAMQKACEINPSSMAAVLMLADEKVEEICRQVALETGEVVVPANYNCPGQLVISGNTKAVQLACEKMKAAGAKRALILSVSGAFHSPLMEPAKAELVEAIHNTEFRDPVCPVYQNVVAMPVTDKSEIKKNLEEQLTGAVRWTQSIERMIQDGAQQFTEVGPGKVLQGLVQKINKEVKIEGVN